MSKKQSDSETSSKKKKINGAAKGKSFERLLATKIRHIFPNAGRMLEFQSGGNIGTDLQDTGDFKFQCKAYAAYAPLTKIKEVAVQKDSDIPVLVTKGNHQPPIAALYLVDFIDILERAFGLKETFTPDEITEEEVKRHKAKDFPKEETIEFNSLF